MSLADDMLDYIQRRRYNRAIINTITGIVIPLILILCIALGASGWRIGIGCITVPPPSATQTSEQFCYLSVKKIGP